MSLSLLCTPRGRLFCPNEQLLTKLLCNRALKQSSRCPKPISGYFGILSPSCLLPAQLCPRGPHPLPKFGDQSQLFLEVFLLKGSSKSVEVPQFLNELGTEAKAEWGRLVVLLIPSLLWKMILVQQQCGGD